MLVPTCVIDLIFILPRSLLIYFHLLLLCLPGFTFNIANPFESGRLLPQSEVFTLEAPWQKFWIQSWVQASIKAPYSPDWIQYFKSLYILGGLPWIISVSSFFIHGSVWFLFLHHLAHNFFTSWPNMILCTNDKTGIL